MLKMRQSGLKCVSKGLDLLSKDFKLLTSERLRMSHPVNKSPGEHAFKPHCTTVLVSKAVPAQTSATSQLEMLPTSGKDKVCGDTRAIMLQTVRRRATERFYRISES